MFYKLKENYLLRGWEKLPYALVDKNRRKPSFITAKEMQALQLCNGQIDLNLPLIPQEIRDMIPEIEKHGIIVPCERGDAIAPSRPTSSTWSTQVWARPSSPPARPTTPSSSRPPPTPRPPWTSTPRPTARASSSTT